MIFLGDYVDGWSESAQVVDFLIDLNKTHRCIFIKGNHDIWCEEWLAGMQPNASWLRHGGEQTIRSYEGFTEEQKKEHLSFFSVCLCITSMKRKNSLFMQDSLPCME